MTDHSDTADSESGPGSRKMPRSRKHVVLGRLLKWGVIAVVVVALPATAVLVASGRRMQRLDPLLTHPNLA